MKKILIPLLSLVSFLVFAQVQETVINKQEESKKTEKVKEQGNKEYIISKMDEPYNFKLNFFSESINPILARFYNNNESNQNNDFVLAMKFITLKNPTSLELIATTKIDIPANLKNITIWTVGRKAKIKLYAILEDSSGKIVHIPFEDENENLEINFLGWKKLTAYAQNNFIQKTNKFDKSQRSPKFIGIAIVPKYKRNSFQYIYFSDLRVSVEELEAISEKDYKDNW